MSQNLTGGAADSTSSSSAPPPETPSLASSVKLDTPEEKAAPPAPAGTQATADKGDTAVVDKATPPDASGNTPVKADPAKPAESTEGKATQPDKPADKEPPAVKADEEVVIDKDQVLSADEITAKFPSSNKGLRAYAATLGEKLNAAQDTLNIVENLGGKEGIDLLLEYADVLANPKATDKFEALLEKFPWHRTALANKVFWSEAENDKPGGSLDLLVKEISEKRFGKEQTLADVLTVMQAVAEGEIDIESLREKSDLKLSASERAERDRKATVDKETQDRLTAAEKKLKETEDTQAQERLEKAYATIATSAEAKWKPEAARLKMLPDENDPKPIAEYRARNLYRILRGVDDELARDPDYEALISLAQNGQSETVAFKMKNAVIANKAMKIFERLARAEAPFFTAAIAGHNGKEIANIANAPSEATGAPSIASPAAAVSKEASGVLDPEKRKQGFRETMEREIARQNAAA